MDLILILVAVALVILVGWLVVKFIPLKLQWLVSIVLWVVAIFFGYQIYESIQAPIRFNKEKKIRYQKVIDNLKMVRDAEEAHYEITGSYSSNFDSLIQFIDTAQFALTEIKNVPKLVDVGGGITKEVTEKVIDTIGYESVKARLFSNRDYQHMSQVPGTDATFELETGEIEKTEGLVVPVFRAQIAKDVVLKGLNKDLINTEKEQIGGNEVAGQYITVGSLDEVSSAGNWPPFYEGKKGSEEKE